MGKKITYKEVDSASWGHQIYFCEFEIVDSILKTHYKELAKLARYIKNRKGRIPIENKDKFLELFEKIEKSNDKRCATSHKKSAEKYQQRKNHPRSSRSKCEHQDLGSRGYKYGDWVKCPDCGEMCEPW